MSYKVLVEILRYKESSGDFSEKEKVELRKQFRKRINSLIDVVEDFTDYLNNS